MNATSDLSLPVTFIADNSTQMIALFVQKDMFDGQLDQFAEVEETDKGTLHHSILLRSIVASNAWVKQERLGKLRLTKSSSMDKRTQMARNDSSYIMIRITSRSR